MAPTPAAIIVRSLCLMTIFSTIFVLRLPFLQAPVLNVDESLWAVYGEALRAGLVPYRDFIEIKPPGIFYIYAFASAFTPWSLLGVRVLALGAHCATAFVLTRIGENVERPWAGYLAAFAYALASSTSVPRDFQAAESEVFLTLASSVGMLAAVRYLKGGGNRWPLFWGFCGFLGFSIKQPAACDFIAMALGLTALTALKHLTRQRLLSAAAFGIAGGLVPLALLLGYFHWRGVLGDMIDAVYFLPKSTYKADDNAFLTVFGCWCDLTRINPAIYGVGLLTTLIGAASAPFWLSCRPLHCTFFLICCWSIGAELGAYMGGHPFAHYFIQTLPPNCLALGFAFAGSEPAGDAAERWANSLKHLGAALAVAGSSMHPFIEFGLPAMRGDVPAFGSEMPHIAEAVASLTEPTDRVGMWGFAPQIFFYARRLPACRDPVGGPMSGWNPYARTERASERVSKQVRSNGLEDYKRNKPKVFVDLSKAGFVELDTFPELNEYIKRHYVIYQKFDVSWWGNDPGHIAIWARLADAP